MTYQVLISIISIYLFTLAISFANAQENSFARIFHKEGKFRPIS